MENKISELRNLILHYYSTRKVTMYDISIITGIPYKCVSKIINQAGFNHTVQKYPADLFASLEDLSFLNDYNFSEYDFDKFIINKFTNR